MNWIKNTGPTELRIGFNKNASLSRLQKKATNRMVYPVTKLTMKGQLNNLSQPTRRLLYLMKKKQTML